MTVEELFPLLALLVIAMRPSAVSQGPVRSELNLHSDDVVLIEGSQKDVCTTAVEPGTVAAMVARRGGLSIRFSLR